MFLPQWPVCLSVCSLSVIQEKTQDGSSTGRRYSFRFTTVWDSFCRNRVWDSFPPRGIPWIPGSESGIFSLPAGRSESYCIYTGIIPDSRLGFILLEPSLGFIPARDPRDPRLPWIPGSESGIHSLPGGNRVWEHLCEICDEPYIVYTINRILYCLK